MKDTARVLFLDLSSTSLTPDERELLASRRFAGLTLFARNVADRFQLADYLAEVRSLAGEDFIVAVDQEGGRVLRVLDVPFPPSAMALGAAADPELTMQVAAATGQALLKLGINVNFAPVADVNVNPLNPVIAERSFGADPVAVSEQVVAFVRGLQEAGVAATVKHFPGHGDTSVDSHLTLPTLERSLADLERLELPPFRAAVAAGVAAVMTAHIVFTQLDPNLPATLSPVVLPRLLRQDLAFDGVVFTDALDMLAIADSFTPTEANLLALQAGADGPLNIGPVSHHLKIADGVDAALRSGRLDAELISGAERRLKHLAGRFPAGAPAPEAVWREGDRELLAEAARRSLVLLGQLPPLDPGVPLTVLNRSGSQVQSAAQTYMNPGDDLVEQLRQGGFTVRHVVYELDGLDVNDTLAQVPHGGLAVFASSLRVTEPEVALVRELADRHQGRFLHLSLLNPYNALDLPQPALASFGYRTAQLKAMTDALRGTPVTGVLPT